MVLFLIGWSNGVGNLFRRQPGKTHLLLWFQINQFLDASLEDKAIAEGDSNVRPPKLSSPVQLNYWPWVWKTYNMKRVIGSEC